MQQRFSIARKALAGPELMEPGVLSCQGCGAALAMKLALSALGKRTMVVLPASCWGIIVGVYPYSALRVPVTHAPFATGAVTASGIRAALDVRGERDTVVMAWAGDGGTFDIGLQSLSGAAERNDDILYVCYDNEAYMNTGIQRSSATPPGAWTSTTPTGSIKAEPKKDIEGIMLAHGIPYLATASIAFPDDLITKFRKAREITGTRFIRLLSPCPPGWRIDSGLAVQVTRMATQSRVFPLYEANAGQCRITVFPSREIPVSQYLEAQGRFRQISPEMIDATQAAADGKWQQLVRRHTP